MHIDVREARVDGASGHKSMNGGTALLYSCVPDLCTQDIPDEKCSITLIMELLRGKGWWAKYATVLKHKVYKRPAFRSCKLYKNKDHKWIECKFKPDGNLDLEFLFLEVPVAKELSKQNHNG